MRAADIVGSWVLVSYVFDFEDGSHLAPYGSVPIGVLSYHPDGHVHVHMMAPDRALLGCDSAEATGQQAGAALATHLSYAGTYDIAAGEVKHHVTISSLQDFVGLTLRRIVRLEGDRLTLTAQNASFGGKIGTSTLIWHRAPLCAGGGA